MKTKPGFMFLAFAALIGSVSGQTEFGINYWPYGQASECLNDSAWPPIAVDYEGTLATRSSTDIAVSESADKPLYAGGWGFSEQSFSGDELAISNAFHNLLNEFKSEEVPLSAVWVFNLPLQEGTWNISPVNNCAYMIAEVEQSNKNSFLP